MKKLYTIFIISFFALLGSSYAQDAHYSQFYASPIRLNPALTGMKNGDLRVVANYRRQWASISNPYTNVNLAADYNILNGRIGENLMGVGLVLINDKAGSADLSRTKVAASIGYSQNLGMEGVYMSVGFQAGLLQQRINWDGLLFESQYNGSELDGNIASGEQVGSTTAFGLDLGAGWAWAYTPDKHNRYFAGAVISHINQAEVSFLENDNNPLATKYTLYGGLEKRINGYFSILPRILYQKQSTQSETNVGGHIKLHLSDVRAEKQFDLSVGGMYRIGDAFIPMVRADYGAFAAALSYDLNLSSLSAASNARGGVELTLIYLGQENSKGTSPIPCPSF